MLSMAGRVRASTDMQYADYWDAFARFIDLDGNLVVRGLFTYQNEHPFVIPNIIYYLDAWLLAGTNRELGYFSLVVAAVTVVLLRSLVPARWSPWARAATTVGISAAIFVPSGIWNFSKGMSGAAWLTANLLAVIALVLIERGHVVPATAAAVLAVATYGTGFGAPVMVSAVALMRNRRDKLGWILPLGALGVCGVVYLLTANGGTSGGDVGGGAVEMASTFLSFLGMLWAPTGGSVAVLAGATGLGVLGLVTARHLRAGSIPADVRPWLGLSVYVIVAGAVVSLARTDVFDGSGVQSRYASLSALFWISVAMAALLECRTHERLELTSVACGVGLAVFYAASPPVITGVLAENQPQDLVAASVRFGAPEAFPARFHQGVDNSTRLNAMGNYPFDGDLAVGCGLDTGDSIDPAALRSDVRSSMDIVEQVDDAASLTGWAVVGGRRGAECVFAVDPTGAIIGAGTTGISRPDVAAAIGVDDEVGFQLFVPITEADYTVVVADGDSRWAVWSPSSAAAVTTEPTTPESAPAATSSPDSVAADATAPDSAPD